MVSKAFEKFEEIEKLEDIQHKHRAWLKYYTGKKYGFGEDGVYRKDWVWTKSSYQDKLWRSSVNLIGRLPNRLRIEFDDKNEVDIPQHLEKVKKSLQELKVGYILSSHKGKSNYIWVEFDKQIKDKEATAFLEWVAPKGSTVDLGFASSNRIFPVLYAVHWKHTMNREMPLEYFEGNQINFSSLNIPITTPGKVIHQIMENKFKYTTFQKASQVFTKQGQADSFGDTQPLFYDKGGNFWLWQENKWSRVDDIDILNMIADTTGQDTISSKNRSEILNALKQYGRKRIPKPIKPTWIQFDDKFVEITTGEKFDVSSEYFATNPIPYNLNNNYEPFTPTLDKIFKEWVGEKYVQTLYEIIAYCLLPQYPMHRIFCLIGGGMNGKSKFLELLRKFIGKANCCSTELDTLLNSRFEVTRLHKKLVCQMGETNFNEMSKTSMLKKLSGGDLIGFEYKNKDPIEDYNYSKIIIATNNLPATTDKTIGFYRRWLIIDFANQFTEKKDILEDIPEEEYSCLAVKCSILLRNLLEKKEFYNEGTIAERKEKYESKSNFLEEFIKLFTIENLNHFITKADFYKKFKAWCKENRHREMSETSLGLQMKKMGLESDRKNFQWMNDGKGGQARVWLGLQWKE